MSLAIATPPADDGAPTRRDEVLRAVLALMVRDGAGISTAAIAKAAACSKETLYKWFGDRDGLLTATVQWQAARVSMPALPEGALDRAGLEAALARFAASWLTVVTGPASVALNRAAISQPDTLGRIVLEHGPRAMAARLEPLLLAARDAGLIGFTDPDAAFTCFFGLVIGDLQLRLLLGEVLDLTGDLIGRRAAEAAARFLHLNPASN